MSKYKAIKVKRQIGDEVYIFPSYAEANRFDYLIALLSNGDITELSTQPKFILTGGFKIHTTKTKSGVSKVGGLTYTPDFKYKRDGEVIIEEVKGHKTTDYVMRLKLFLSKAWDEFGVSEFIEITNNKETIYYTKTCMEVSQ